MTINIEEVLSNHLQLVSRNRHIDASIELTKAIREVYFNSPELVNSELFKLMVLSERKEIERINSGIAFRAGHAYQEVLKSRGNIAFSNINTLLMIKLEKEGLIDPIEDNIKNLMRQEATYICHFGLDTILERTACAIFQGGGDFNFISEAEATARNLGANVHRFRHISDRFQDRTYLSDFENYILDQINYTLEKISTEGDSNNQEYMKFHIQVLFGLMLVNWCLGYETERNYLLIKLKEIVYEENNFYWTVRFLCKELIL